ncbi:MAG: XdhC family protein [Bacteroidales bacterium]|jgi:xanthine dehydrogenase accessory factor
MESIFLKAEESKNGQKRAAICIIVDTTGSTPRKRGSKMIVYADGSTFGSIGGGNVEKEVTDKAVELIASGQPTKFTFNLEKDLAMHCGGTMEVYIEPINPSQKLYIFGAGHIGRAVALFARELDFSITVFDPRENIFRDPVFKGCTCISNDYFSSIEEASFDENTYCVIVTPKHLYDEDILAKLSKKSHAYIGMLGSSRKVELLKKRFLEEKIMSREELEKIDMPIGIRFLANTPQEIAISILAKLIDVRNSLINSNS